MKQNYTAYLPIFAAGIFCLCLLCGTRASAADENPCAGDIAKFCKDVKPGAVMDCLEENEKELSDACKTYETKMGGKKVEMREEVRQMKILLDTCKEDMAKFCKDVQPGQGGIEKCLNEHLGELCEPCGEQVKARTEETAKEKTR